jgi:dTMP kinase
MHTGKFITFEGGEGSGKSTQSDMLYNHLLNQEIDVIHTREIGGTEAGEQMRNILLNHQLASISELLLIMSARCQHIDKIIAPALKQGKWVICDRFIDSTAAYQGNNPGISERMVYDLHGKLLNNIVPDKTFFIKVTPEIALQRIASREVNNKFDHKQLEFHRNVYRRFLKISKKHPNRIKIIDGTLDPEKIHNSIIEDIDL